MYLKSQGYLYVNTQHIAGVPPRSLTALSWQYSLDKQPGTLRYFIPTSWIFWMGALKPCANLIVTGKKNPPAYKPEIQPSSLTIELLGSSDQSEVALPSNRVRSEGKEEGKKKTEKKERKKINIQLSHSILNDNGKKGRMMINCG